MLNQEREMQPTTTTTKSKMFQLEHQKRLSQCPYMFTKSSTRNMRLNMSSSDLKAVGKRLPVGSICFSITFALKLAMMRNAMKTWTCLLLSREREAKGKSQRYEERNECEKREEPI